MWMAFALPILHVFVHVFMNLLLVGEGVCGKNVKKGENQHKIKRHLPPPKHTLLKLTHGVLYRI